MKEFDYFGVCAICGTKGPFTAAANDDIRDTLTCTGCQSPLKLRDQAAVLIDEFGRGQARSLVDLKRQGALEGVRVFDANKHSVFKRAFGEYPQFQNGAFEIETSDVASVAGSGRPKCHLPFADQSFDLVLSTDVMDQLPDIESALAEVLRVLCVGGRHVFTVATSNPFPDAMALSAENSGPQTTEFGADLVDLVQSLGGQISVIRRSDVIGALHDNATFVMRRMDGVLRDLATRPRPVLKQALPGDATSEAQDAAVPSEPPLAELEIARNFTCPVCGAGGLLPFNGRPNARCSGCGAMERNRLMAMFLEAKGAYRPGVRVLHMAPEGIIGKKFSKLPLSVYDARDFEPERYKSAFFKVHKIDLCTDLAGIEDDSYDVILHSHVLEHLPCDVEQVLLEFNRILAPGGMHFFAVPMRGAKTDEDLSPDLTDAERHERFGQHDHMRIFGRDDLTALLDRVWGPGPHALNGVVAFGHEALKKAAIPREAWSGLSGHSVFFHKKAPSLLRGPVQTFSSRFEALDQLDVYETDSPIGSDDIATRRGNFCRWVLNRMIPARTHDRLIDLGAGHMTFSKIAKQAGYDVLALDAREAKLPENRDGIDFVQADLRGVNLASFDVVLALGVFYHLNLADQIALLKAVPEEAVLVLDTQIHDPDHIEPVGNAERKGFAETLVEQDGYEGVLFPENGAPSAGFETDFSFWPTEASQLQMLADCGFQNAYLLGAPYMVKFGPRRWIVAGKSSRPDPRAVNSALPSDPVRAS